MADDPRVLALVEQYIARQHLINKTINMLDDPGRVDVVTQVSDVIDAKTQEALDRACNRVCQVLNVPISAVTLVNDSKQLILGACGMSKEPMQRDHSFCIFVAASGMPFSIQDLQASDEDLACLPVVSTRHIRAYLGRPIVLHGQTVGALCAVDFVTREWTDVEHELLDNYAAHVTTILEEKT